MHTREVKKLKRKILFFLALINLIIVICSYNIMPVIFNYPPFAESNFKFQNDIEPLNHIQQYIVVFIVLTIIFSFIINILMKNIFCFLNKYYRKQNISDEEKEKIRKDCFNIPYQFYLSEITISWAIGIIFSAVLGVSNSVLQGDFLF